MDYLSLCLICKDENDYLPEWLDYHITMGVDRFYVYDNESRLSLRESLKYYIKCGWVVVIDIYGKAMQLNAYDHCLQVFGSDTVWMGFIDTDEFLVPKNTFDLKELLRGYEPYGGLAVSSIFFGYNGHQTRPDIGQIAAYTRRTHEWFKENELIKSIVQPRLVLMPNSPHDFIYKQGAWCVNESFQQVDYQSFPNHTEKIQLNHYFCRSILESEQKIKRGRGDAGEAWAHKRFDLVNQLANYSDTTVIDNISQLFLDLNPTYPLSSVSEKIRILAQLRRPLPLETIPVGEAISFRIEFSSMESLKAQTQEAINLGRFVEAKQLILHRLQILPQKINLYIDLAIILLDQNNTTEAWQVLTHAWQISPHNYQILGGMAFYFLRVENFKMAENTCHLLLELAPHDLTALGMLTHSLIGQGRFGEALEIGVPVIQQAGVFGELPEKLGIFLIKKMADYLLEKKDYTGAVHLWEIGAKYQPEDVNVLLELNYATSLQAAGKRLNRPRQLSSQNGSNLSSKGKRH